MILTYSSGRFVVRSTYEEKDFIKQVGCRWSVEDRFWWTDRAVIARKLEKYADRAAKEALEKAYKKIEESKQTNADIDIPSPEGCEYLGYQKAGIKYSIDRNSVLIADEMGLGKTIQALGVINADQTIKNILVICPASLRLNWAREAAKWLVRKMYINIITTEWVKTVEGFNIINYDILKRLNKDTVWDLLIVDECHFLKNRKAKRTREVMGFHKKREDDETVKPILSRKKIFLTGTPIVNRPIELYSIISYLDPERWGNWYWFSRRFCGATEGYYGMDVSGASNLDELQDSLRSTLMIRRLKKDVLTELPPKRRQIIEIPANGNSEIISREQEEFKRIQKVIEQMQTEIELSRAGTEDEYTKAVNRLKVTTSTSFSQIAKIRHETALAKVSYVVEHVEEILEEEDCLVVMAHHHDVINKIREGLLNSNIQSVQLTGENTLEERQRSVDLFQEGKAKVFIGSIHAAGLGITLTRASTVIFAELDWVPGNISQAEDRLHRIGQHESVLVKHIVLEGSIDAIMAKTIVEKQSVIDQALDVLIRNEPILPLKEERKTNTRNELMKEAETITDEEVMEIHLDLKRLATGDKDHANIKNGIGFNKIDTSIGNSLANQFRLTKLQAALGKKILKKYSNQLDK